MSKLSLTDLTNLQNEQTAVTALNANSAATETALENTLSRDGSTPNEMNAVLDMNSNRVINLSSAVSTSEPITLGQMNSILASGVVPNGLVTEGVPVSAVMQPVLAATTLEAAHAIFDITSNLTFNVEDYGAVQGVLGGPSQHAAIQDCIDAAALVGGTVFLPGHYAISTTINLPAGVTITGLNITSSGLYPASTIDAITVSTAGAIQLQDFAITYFIPPSTGALGAIGTSAIRHDLSSAGSRIKNIAITGAWRGITITKSAFFVIESCFINGFVNAGIFVDNEDNTDSGDSTILNCTLIGVDTSAQAGIAWQGSGGLRILNNKIVTANNGVLFSMADVSATTGALFVIGNSIEGIVGGGGVLLNRQGSGAFMRHVIIANNELTGQAGVWVPPDAFSATWIGSLVINGNNYINVNQNGSVMIALDHVIGFTATNNLMRTLGSTGTAIAVIAATCDQGLVGPNLGFAEGGGASINASVISATNTTTISPT